jgi:hypothetical protein
MQPKSWQALKKLTENLDLIGSQIEQKASSVEPLNFC